MRLDLEKPRLMGHVFRTFGASVPVETRSQSTKTMSDNRRSQTYLQGGGGCVMRWNVLLSLSENPPLVPTMIDDVPPRRLP
jgi:hypothetical protein